MNNKNKHVEHGMGNPVATQAAKETAKVAGMAAAKTARILQITDTHLYSRPGETLVGMDCDEGLQDVLELVRARELASTEPPACVLFTGDASQDNSPASYQRLELLLGSLGLPQYWIPGNHDELAQMQAAIGHDNACFQTSIALGNWRIVQLNSSVAGKVHGRLADQALAGLRAEFEAAGEDHVLVTLHHNPVPVQAAWLQQHALQNPGALFAEIDAEPRVRAVIFGHIHHDLSVLRNGVQYLGAPSTCVQFHPASREFALDDLNPGYRWLDLFADGSLATGVNRVVGKQYDIDFSGIGY